MRGGATWWALWGVALVLGVATRAWPASAYATIDRQALAVPDSAEGSVRSLAAALARPARDDREKVRAIFRWMTAHISYDEEGFRTGRYGSADPDSVLQSRRSVCAGYARLFEALAKAAGLEVVRISGHGKGVGYRLGAPAGETNHDWNAVKLEGPGQGEGRWHLVDVTWGAGAVINGHWRRRFTEHYFLTPPDQFIYDHFPKNPKWQLLDRPLTRAQYGALVYLRPAFFQQGLVVESHPRARFSAGDSARLVFRGPKGVQVLARLAHDGGEDLPDRWALCQHGGGRYEVVVRWPRAGRYRLTIYAKGPHDAGAFWDAAEYVIDAGAGAACGFPRMYSTLAERGGRLHEPLNGVLAAGRAVRFRIAVPGAQEVTVVSGHRWQKLSRRGDEFAGTVTPAAGRAQVVAGTWVLAEYEAR